MFSTDLANKAEIATRFFKSAIQKNKLFHSYLLCGSNNELKDDLSYQLTKVLNCSHKNENFDPCGTCSNCIWISSKTHPETPIILEPDLEKSKKGVILTKQVQALLSKLQSKSKFYRVVIIKKSEVDFLPAESANSLLKTIEEPNPGILFLIYSKDKDLVLPTISSRCQILNLPSSKESHQSQLISSELHNKIFTRQISFFEASQLAKEIHSQYKDINSIMNFLDSLIEKCLELTEKGNQNLLNKKIQLIDNAKNGIKSFCSPQIALEEMLWSFNR
ncbi:MAG: hypothetical protein QNJ31_08180 [Candidatus Caenarcaniphilales bacterium]|nr:hypothetical protein [Candidatus Caenarcaniphilales bacterium]